MDSDERSLLHETLNPPSESSNDDLHQYVPSLDPAESNNGDLAAEIEAANQDLVEEVKSLRDALSENEHTTGLLQKERNENHGRVEALSAEIPSLEVEKRELAGMAACLAQDVETLHAEKVDLLDENAKITLENESLDATHTEMKKRLSSLENDLHSKQAAMASAQAQILITFFEMEKLKLEKEEFLKEISTLDASNGSMNAQVVHLKEESKALSNKVENIIALKGSAEQKVLDLQGTIAELGEQLATWTKNEKLTPNQLDEAKVRLHYLEDLNNAMALREKDMVAHIKDLESQLHTLRTNYQAQHEEVAKADNLRSVEITCMKVTTSERDLHTLRLSSETQEGDVDARWQHVQDLESQVTDLRAETQGLVRSNEDLKDILRQQQESEMVVSTTQLREDIEKVEGSLNEAKDRVQALKGKEAELNSKLQELNISASKERRLGGLAIPLVISGGTVVVAGLLIFYLHTKAKAK